MECLSEDYIGENGIVISNDSVNYITSGGNSRIWRYDNAGKSFAFKEFYDDRACYSLKYDVYQRMRDLELENIIKPLESYKKVSNTREKSIDAYLMDFIFSHPDFSSMNYPIGELLESIIKLEKDIESLSNAHIIMYDVGPKNTIVSDDYKMNIVDIDMYYYDRLTSIDTVYSYNRKQLFNLIRLILFRGLIHCQELEEKSTEIKEFLSKYFNAAETDENLSVRVEQLFGNYENPKQCLLERKL